MAGDWIKMRTNLWDDPRVSRLCDLTCESEAAVIGALYWLWSAADEHTEEGIMPGLSLAGIDRKTSVKGIGAALVAVGWLAEHPEGVRIVRFKEHNGSSAKRRCSESRRKMSARDADNERTESGSGEDGLQQSCAPREDVDVDNPSTSLRSVDGSPSSPPAVSEKKQAKRASQLPADFFPNETGVAYAEQRGIGLAIELESFRNWHHAKGSTMKDWQAAWRTWCDKAVQFGRANGARASPKTPTRDEARREVMRVLTGKGGGENGRERDITGEAVRVA